MADSIERRLIDADAFIDSLGSEDADIYCKDLVHIFAEEHEIKPAEQRTVTDDDTISRQAAIDAISEGVGDDAFLLVALVKSKINEVPSAEPERKTGHWIDGGRNRDGTFNIYCSECGAGFKTRGHARSIYTAKKFKVCPTCGIKMQLSQRNGDLVKDLVKEAEAEHEDHNLSR